VNGLRSVKKNGYFEQIIELQPDAICLQETKLSDSIILEDMLPLGYRYYCSLSKRKGLYGVAIITKLPVKRVSYTSGFERCDSEGRFLLIEFENDITLVCLYMPHGKRDRSDISYKIALATYLISYFKSIAYKPVVIATDFNIAHKDVDLAHPSENRANVMFTNDERKVVDFLLSVGYTDAFRYFCKDEGKYSWWTYAFNARERNLGWRIDYIFISDTLKSKVISIDMHSSMFGSDHCPLEINVDWM